MDSTYHPQMIGLYQAEFYSAMKMCPAGHSCSGPWGTTKGGLTFWVFPEIIREFHWLNQPFTKISTEKPSFFSFGRCWKCWNPYFLYQSEDIKMIEDFETSYLCIFIIFLKRDSPPHLPSKRQALRRLYDAQVLLQSYEDKVAATDKITWYTTSNKKMRNKKSPIPKYLHFSGCSGVKWRFIDSFGEFVGQEQLSSRDEQLQSIMACVKKAAQRCHRF